MKNLRNLLTPLIISLFVATGAQGAFYQWSKTASSNATADPSINWSEGMSPSSVNDSGRAMMARAAEYRDDISGALTTSGTATAFTVTTNQGLTTTPTDGQLLAFTPHTTSGIAPTLAADGGTAFPIQTSPGVVVTNATLVQGTPYTVKFSNANSAWILRNFYGAPFVVPIGGIIPYTGATAPNSSFILPYGQCISRTTYATYFAQVSTTFGTCDGVTTFAVPDLRGRAIAGIDNMGGSAASRLTSTYFGADGAVLGNTGGAESHTLSIAELPVITPSGTIGGQSSTHVAHGTSIADLAAGGSGYRYSDVPSFLPATGFTFTGIPFGSGNAHAIVQPTMVLNYILRVL